MTTQKLICTGLTIAGITLLGGIAAKKPLLINAGMNLGLTSGVARLITKQNQAALEPQIATPAPAELSELADIQTTLEKLEKQVKEQRTRQNATLSKVSKLDHKQKVTAIAIDKKVDKLLEISDRHFDPQPAPTVEKVEQPSAPAPLRLPVTHAYIDGNNVRFAAKDMDIDIDYKALRLLLMPKNGKAIFHFYTGIFPTPTYAQKSLISRLKEYGYQVSQLPVVQRQDGTYKTQGDDVKIGIDMTEECQKGERVILVSGDGDFIPAVEKLQAKGVKVTVAGHKDSINYELRRLADHFLDLDSIKYQIAKHTKLVIA